MTAQTVTEPILDSVYTVNKNESRYRLKNISNDFGEAVDQVMDKIAIVMGGVKADWHCENDGIGPYEYWGFRGFDKGNDYIVVEGNDSGRVVTLEVDVSDVANVDEFVTNFVGCINVSDSFTVGGCTCDEDTPRGCRCRCSPEFSVNIHVQSSVVVSYDKHEKIEYKDGKKITNVVYSRKMILDLSWCGGCGKF